MHGNLYLIHNFQHFGPHFQAHWKRAQTVCMFSVLKATEKEVEEQQKKKRPVFNKYAAAVTSFVESYVAAKQSYPKVSEVVRGTGGTRSTITRILSELNLDKKTLECKKVCIDGPDHIRIRCIPASMTDSACRCVDEFEPLTAEVVSAQIDVLTDVANFTSDAEQLTTEVESAQVEVSNNTMDSKDIEIDEIDVSANLKRNGPSEPALLTLLDQAMHSNNKADANKRVAPLMEVLQHKSSSSSRRVHLSASGGIENDLSWEQTLSSIMPLSAGGKKDSFVLKDEQPKFEMYSIEQTPSCLGKDQDRSENASNSTYTVKVIPQNTNSVLCSLSGSQLKNVFKKDIGVFKDLKSVKTFSGIAGIHPYAILQFRNSKSMKEALNLKSIKVRGERLSLHEGWVPVVDATTGLEKTSIFQQIMQGMIECGPQKKKEIVQSPTYLYGEDEKTDVCMETRSVSSRNFSQTIMIEECPTSISDKSINTFFSVFGELETSCVNLNHTSKQTVFVDFKNVHDKEKALKVQQFTVDGCSFRIKPDASSGPVLVRLTKQQSSINQKAGIVACRKYGSLKGVFTRNPVTVDLNFGENDRDRMEEILKSLREDEFLKGKFKVSCVWETYTKSDVFEAYEKGKVETLLSSLEELVTELNCMLSAKMQALNQVAADVKHI